MVTAPAISTLAKLNVLRSASRNSIMHSLQTGRHFVIMHRHHVKSCMTTGCIRPFLAVYAEAIAQGLGLIRGLGFLLRSSKHCLPTGDAILWDILQMLLSKTVAMTVVFYY